jgi:D-3-phosphoglycerate dehydrogenase
MKVVVSTSSFAAASLEALRGEGHEVVVNPHGRTLTGAEALELLRDADGVIAGTEPLTREVLTAAPRLRVISRVGVGIDGIDLDTARERGIVVANTPDAVTDAAAELTVAGLLALLRHVHLMHADLNAGVWRKRMGSLLRDKTVGIVGYGRVGRRVAALLDPFGARLLAHDPVLTGDLGPAEAATLDDLLRESDVVTVHASGDAGTLIGEREIARLKHGAYLVNAARGGLVDETALERALQEGRLAGAYLDTFADEPYDGPLLHRDDVLVTAHAGSYAIEARTHMEREAVGNLLRALA